MLHSSYGHLGDSKGELNTSFSIVEYLRNALYSSFHYLKDFKWLLCSLFSHFEQLNQLIVKFPQEKQ